MRPRDVTCSARSPTGQGVRSPIDTALIWNSGRYACLPVLVIPSRMTRLELSPASAGVGR